MLNNVIYTISPYLYCSIDIIVIGAVSVRKILGPIFIGRKPFLIANSSSFFEKSPSGPIKTFIF